MLLQSWVGVSPETLSDGNASVPEGHPECALTYERLLQPRMFGQKWTFVRVVATTALRKGSGPDGFG